MSQRPAPKVSKKFDANFGVLLDSSFEEHRRDCADCQRFDSQKPATGALMCLEGSVLWKRDNAVRKPSASADRDEHRGTKAQVKALTRYKGE